MKPGGPAGGSAPTTLRKVLETSPVRERIVEYLGGHELGDATCLFLGRLDADNPSRFVRHPTDCLDTLLDESCELARSLEDRVSLLVHLDIEYVNFDDPAAAYVDARRIFQLQEPLVAVIEAQLLRLGIHYLHVVTGQGHHFVWKIRKCSPVAVLIAYWAIRRGSASSYRKKSSSPRATVM